MARDQGPRAVRMWEDGRLEMLAGPGGKVYWVEAGANTAYDTRNGKTASRAFGTLGKAITEASARDVLALLPGEHAAEATIPYTKPNITIVSVAGRGAAWIKPAAANATALVNKADATRLIDIACEGKGTGVGFRSYASRVRAYGAKFEGGANPAEFIGGENGGGRGGDILLHDCEICWSAAGIKLSQGFIGGVTQLRIRHSLFHNLTASAIVDGDGLAAGRFRNLLVADCDFENMEDGTEPTMFLSLNGSNSNSGKVTRCSFPVALNSAKNLVSTAVEWVGNLHPAGLSTGQPS